MKIKNKRGLHLLSIGVMAALIIGLVVIGKQDVIEQQKNTLSETETPVSLNDSNISGYTWNNIEKYVYYIFDMDEDGNAALGVSDHARSNYVKKQIRYGNTYDIDHLQYTKNDVDISYPHITGLHDVQIQQKINNLLKNEAFSELIANNNTEDLSLFIEYEISYQDKKYLCVKYTGMIYIKNSPYPRSIFTTINIDLNKGFRLKLSDMVSIDKSFVKIVRESLQSYIDKNSDWEIMYRDKLKLDDYKFVTLFLGADSESNSDCFSYFNRAYFGISFATSHVAGNHFEIELDLGDISKYLNIDIDAPE